MIVYYLSHKYNTTASMESLYIRSNSLFTNFPNIWSYVNIMNCGKGAQKLVKIEIFIDFCWLFYVLLTCIPV